MQQSALDTALALLLTSLLRLRFSTGTDVRHPGSGIGNL